MLAVMFVAFIVQIVFRYFFNFPVGWTSELTRHHAGCGWCSGAPPSCVKESEEIRFDLARPARPAGARASRMGDRRRAGARSCCTRRRCRRRSTYVTFMKVEKTSYLKIRMDWLFSIYLIFLVAVIVRYAVDRCGTCCAARSRRGRPDQGELRPVNLASPFSLARDRHRRAEPARPADRPRDDRAARCSTCGSPGVDMGTAAEQLLNGMYSSYVLLAIPLFILAAEFMNSGSIMDRLLRFCNALVGRFRGGLAQVNVVQSIIFASMSGSALADAAGSRQADADADDQGRQVHAELRRRADRRLLGDRADHPAVDPAGALRAGLRHVDRLPVPRRRRSRAC